MEIKIEKAYAVNGKSFSNREDAEAYEELLNAIEVLRMVCKDDNLAFYRIKHNMMSSRLVMFDKHGCCGGNPVRAVYDRHENVFVADGEIYIINDCYGSGDHLKRLETTDEVRVFKCKYADNIEELKANFEKSYTDNLIRKHKHDLYTLTKEEEKIIEQLDKVRRDKLTATKELTKLEK